MLITTLYAGVLGLIYLVLTARVIRRRQTDSINLGSGGDATMERRIRGHANFNEYVPFLLVVMALSENAGASTLYMHAVGLTLVVARLLHGYAFAFTEHWFKGRFYGATLTILLLLIASIGAVYFAAAGLLG